MLSHAEIKGDYLPEEKRREEAAKVEVWIRPKLPIRDDALRRRAIARSKRYLLVGGVAQPTIL